MAWLRSRRVAAVVSVVWLGAACQPAPSGSSTPAADVLNAIYAAGDAVMIDALDSGGRWGSITLTRGDDAGGYPTGGVPADSFVVEVQVSYAADRKPTSSGFGLLDWTLTPTGHPFAPVMPADPAEWDAARLPLDNFREVEASWGPFTGRIYFLVPRDAADESLVLVYRPAEALGRAMHIPVRQPGPAPAPVPTATPVPTPVPVTYVGRDGAPFTIIDSSEADALFSAPDTCTNPVAGYIVTYPDDWWTNTAIGSVAACSWFAPTSYDVANPNVVPDEVVIVIWVYDGAFGFVDMPRDSLHEEISVDGYEAVRRQNVGMCYSNGGCQDLPPSYEYTVILSGSQAEGPTLRAVTSSEGTDQYILNRAVLDRMMASFQSER